LATGVKITGSMVPSNPHDTYALLEDNYLLGSYRVVATVSDRDNIPVDRRKWGMLVGVNSENKIYQLVDSGNNDLSDNTNWVELSLAAGGSTAKPVTDIFTLTDVDITNRYVTLTKSIDTSQHEFVFLNGILLEPGAEYTATTNQIHFTDQVILTPGDKVIVKYYS